MSRVLQPSSVVGQKQVAQRCSAGCLIGFDPDELRTAISDRERQLKKSLARLANPHALEMWRGDAGVARFDFRWRVGRSAVNDIATGLQAA